MVTANHPAFSRAVSRIDVAVSALGDATSLTGGTLIVTPLLAADGQVYAVAQGAIIAGGISAEGEVDADVEGDLLAEDESDRDALTLADFDALELADFDALRLGDTDPVELAETLTEVDWLTLTEMLPDGDGLDFLRQRPSPAPVLVLTARGALNDRIEGLDRGAEDYLVKPFALAELAARLTALVRRSSEGRAPAEPLLRYADVEMDLSLREVRRGERLLELTRMGFTILELLLRRAPAVVPRSELERHLWGEELPGSDALRTHIHALRSAVDPPGTRTLLQTHRGIGWQLCMGPP
jgi:DNA-binding response OmpR family regulator